MPLPILGCHRGRMQDVPEEPDIAYCACTKYHRYGFTFTCIDISPVAYNPGLAALPDMAIAEG